MLSLDWQLGYRKVECNSDHFEAIWLISGAIPIHHHYGSIIADIKQIMERE